MALRARTASVLPALLLLLLACFTTASSQPLFTTPNAYRVLLDPSPIGISESDASRFSNFTYPCDCSPTARGHPPLSDPLLRDLVPLLRRLPFADRLALPPLKLRIGRIQEMLINRYGREGFVNLDAAMRSTERVTVCFHDTLSGRNVFPLRDLPATGWQLLSLRGCDQIPPSRSTPQQTRGFMPSPGPKMPGEVPNPLPGLINVIPGLGDGSGAPPAPVSAPGPAAAPSPAASAPNAAAAASTPTPAPTPATDRNRSEGCVAIEHLSGAVLQHPTHLWRPTLCAGGFCATPNHALIVDGVWTSMKRLCAGQWECMREMRWVNNLKIEYATRLKYDAHIVITPYDLRFPVAGPWTVQMGQDALRLVFMSVKLAALVVAGMFVAAAMTSGGDELADKVLVPAESAVNAFESCRLDRVDSVTVRPSVAAC